MKELNKMVQNLKMEIETINKSQMEPSLKMGNIGNRTETTDARIINRIQEMEEKNFRCRK